MSRKLNHTEEELRKYARKIPVNSELKESLREQFSSKEKVRRPGRHWVFGLVAACAIVLVGLYAVFGGNFGQRPQPLLASDVKVANQVSFVDIATGSYLPPVIGDGQLYLPVPDQGTMVLPLTNNEKGEIKKLTGKDILFSSLSHDGKTAACVTSKGIYLYNLDKKMLTPVVTGNDQTVFYNDPSWAPDDKSLLVTKDVERWLEHGHETVSLDIYQVSLDGKTIKKVTGGSYASFTPDGKSIIFEHDGKVMLRTLSSSDEKVVDYGRFPRVSPDGSFVAYVKTAHAVRQLRENASVVTDLPDVWICSVDNFNDKRKLTNNYPNKFMDESAWLKTLPSTGVKQALGFSGTYDYYNPVWGSDSSTLYVLKNSNVQERISLMRIDLSPQSLEAVDTVAHWFEAYINRDDDFARSLMVNPAGFMSVSNPHPVAYAITGSGTKDGQSYVDVRQTVVYNADSYYALSNLRFNLAPGGEGFKIKSIDNRGGFEVVGKDGRVLLNKGKLEKELLAVEGIKPVDASGNSARLSSLALSSDQRYLIYTVQRLKGFTINVYDLHKKKTLNSMTISEGESAVMDISFSGNQRFAAVRYLADLSENGTKVMLYDLKHQKFIQNSWLTGSSFWAGDQLLVTKTAPGTTVRWSFDPITGKKKL